ncbi:MAG: peptidoglycan DD-metalloendopeptidase family protein [Desulfosarcinaceae bacterium]
MRIDRKWLAGLLMVSIVMGMTVWTPSVTRGAETGFVRVMDLTLRCGPGQDTRPIKTLARGALVTVLGRKNGWLKIRHEGHTGYILNKSDYIRLLSEDGASSPDETSSSDEAASADAISQTGLSDLRRRERIESQLETSAAQLVAIQEKEISFLDAVDQQILATETDLGALEDQIQTERSQLEDLEDRLEVNSAYAGRRVRALHQLNSLGTLPVLANAESWMDFLKRKAALSMVIETDRRLLDQLAVDRQRQKALLAKLSQRRGEHRELENKLRRELADLTARLAERSELLAQIRSEASLQENLIEGLKASAKALDTTITQLAAPEAPAAIPEGESEPEALATGVLPAQAGRSKNNRRPFIKLKGLLNLPVNGKIVSSYGHYRDAEFNVLNFRSGVLIRADRGEPIHAVANGTTLFADWFRGYGNMLIIDHGDHYYTVYAHLEALFKARGDSVDADEVIATVGETATPAGPGLHFEVRHYGKPVDPLAWLRTTDRAASDRKKGVKG